MKNKRNRPVATKTNSQPRSLPLMMNPEGAEKNIKVIMEGEDAYIMEIQ